MRHGVRAFLALTLAALGPVADPAQADPPALWSCGDRSGSDVTFVRNARRDANGKVIPRNPDAPRSPFPRGGSYIRGGAAANLSGSKGTVWLIGPFDVACHAVVVNGQPMRPDGRWRRDRLIEFEGSAAVIGHDGSAIILRGIPIAWWRRGASRQILGSSNNDTLTGTDGADVIVPGAGHDRVVPGGGDDAIVFTSGVLVIADDPANTGADHIELTRFERDDPTFTASGADLIISTPDGYIRVVNQLATPGGHLERLRLGKDNRDDWIDAAWMRAQVRSP